MVHVRVWRLFVLLSISVFYHNSALAQEACKQVFLKRASAEESKSLVPANDNSLLSSLEQTIESWNEMLGDMASPDVHLMLLNKGVESSAYSAPKNLIALGIQLEHLPQVALKAIMAHEFGHSVFNEHFILINGPETISAKQVSVDAAENIERAENDPKLIKMNHVLRELQRTLEVAVEAGDKEAIKELTEYINIQQTRLAPHMDAIHKFNFLHEALIPYNELFADSFVTLLFKDPHILSKTLGPKSASFLEKMRYRLYYRSRNKNAPAPRDFSMTSFKGWQHELGDIYTLLDPSRGVLWNLYMERLQPGEIPLFMKTFLRAVSTHLSERLNREENPKAAENPEVDAAQLNREFLRHFMKAAKDLGLPMRKSTAPKIYRAPAQKAS